MKAKRLLASLALEIGIFCISFAIWCIAVYAEDIITLIGGRQLRGKIIEETEDHVKVQGKYGIQEINQEDVASIQRGLDFDAEYKQQAAKIGERDAEGW